MTPEERGTKFAPNDFRAPLPERLSRMRQRYFTIKPSLSIHRAVAHTRVAREHWGLNRHLLKARCIYHACESVPIYIGDDELIVGLAGGRPRAGIISPDLAWRWLAKELETISSRRVDPYELSSEDKKTLEEEIFPFWRQKSVDEKVYKNLEELGLLPITFETGIIDCEVKTTSGGGDLCPGYGNILFKKGFSGIQEDAARRLGLLREEIPAQLDQIFFLKAVIMVCDGMMLLAARYAAGARAQAAAETRAERREELLRIAQVMDRVPAHPPTNFHEALQTIWFGQAMLYLEELTAGTSPGRVDQYVYPFYQADIKSGVLSAQKAQELMYCFLYKFNENAWPLSEFGSKYFSGYMPYQNIVVGGMTPDGSDATNELTYMIIACVGRLRMFQPSLTTRVHRGSPQEYLEAIVELVGEGLGFPNIQTDEVAIKALVSNGISLKDARDYCVMGCTEPHVQGRLVRWASATYTNFGIPIEFVFTGGVHRATGRTIGLKTGPLDQFDTFEKFEAAVKEQIRNIFRICAVTTIVVQQVHQEHPKPLGSALTEGCVESGRDYMFGGAMYNTGPGIICVGTAEYANSMVAVRKLVYQEKKITLAELARALTDNFVGHPDIYRLCAAAPKYGNDLDEVDGFARDLIDFAYAALREQRGLFAPLELSTLSVSSNVPQGEALGALPSGRKAGTPLPDGISPAQGTDTAGPTAAIKSIDKIAQWQCTDGTLYNVTLSPDLLRSSDGRAGLIALLRAHQLMDGAQIQFNCVKRETLHDAQLHPERYRSLMVRVAGYSAFFTELPRELQDDIISRTMQNRL